MQDNLSVGLTYEPLFTNQRMGFRSNGRSIYVRFLTFNRSCAAILVSVFQTETKMGTYTTNYNLFLPTIGEQGWGELVNGNFTTIDTTMGGLNTRVETLETDVDTIDEKVTTLEAGNFETITVDKIEGLNMTTEANVIGAISLSTSTTLVTVAGNGSTMSTNNASYTYTKNIINNTVEIVCYAKGGANNSGTYPARAYLKVNGTTVVDTGSVTTVTTKNINITLNEGDALYAYVESKNGGSTYVQMNCSGYLCK